MAASAGAGGKTHGQKKSAPRWVRLQFGHVSGRAVNAGSIYKTCVSSKILSGNFLPSSSTSPQNSILSLQMHHRGAEGASS
jgi:hypothetical protein